MKYRESRITAHHNYLVKGLVTPGFVVGDPSLTDQFFFLADVVLPGESGPRISGRVFDELGRFLTEIQWNRIRKNPGQCSHQPYPGGFRILLKEGTPLLEVLTQQYANGSLTRIKARLYDEKGQIRIEASGESMRIIGEYQSVLQSPFAFP